MAGAFWDDRFADEDYLFGTGPNQFVVDLCSDLPPGAALDLGCGEGRNAVWLAGQGHTVTGVDASAVGLEKARRLASTANVEVSWVHADLGVHEPTSAAWDLVVLSYVHVPHAVRVPMHHHAAQALAVGGRLVLVGHHVRNVVEGVGGPQDPALLFDEEMLIGDFGDLEVVRAEMVSRAVAGADRNALDVVFVAVRD